MKTAGMIERRSFIRNVALLSVTSGLSLKTGSITQKEEEGVTPAEDLMREHGVLSRILLIYDTCRQKLSDNQDFDMKILSNSARIVRSFVEDYHEKLEEDFIFPRFSKADKLKDLVNVLKNQHEAGRRLTDPILKLDARPTSDKKNEVIRLLADFGKMYRPHKSREDTVLFPAMKEIIPEKEYLELGEKFEDKENELFGEKGFESVVAKVEDLEKQLNIYDLAQFTPSK
jgi:hemerythrin-like domain-containing protein